MSVREEKILSLTNVDLAKKSTEDLASLYNEVLSTGIHGLCSSPYEEGQQPGDTLTEEQIRRRLKIIQPYTKWIRSFSCTEGNELIPKIARELGIKTFVGAWLGNDAEINKKEIDGLIKLANEGYVDAYYEFEDRPAISDACDIILANCYPFWEGCHQDYSLLYMKDMYRRAQRAGKGKKVIITETGWPNQGSSLAGAVPSEENAMKYFINAQLWSKEEDIDLFYFSSFDESWKVGSEGDVGSYWGIWDKDEKLKFSE